MRRTRRFRRNKQLWLPAYGNGGTTVEGVTNGTGIGQLFELENDGTEDGGIDWLASPLTFDTQVDPENVQQDTPFTNYSPRLRDLVSGSEWALRRIVGKCFVTVSQCDNNTGKMPAIEVGCGIIVCNTDEDGGPTTDFNQVNPLTQQASEDPWVWMRHWLLSTWPGQNLSVWNNGSANGFALNPAWFAQDIPRNNMQYGSVQDGPHVDQKTVRRIRRDQRLFFIMATRPNSLTSQSGFTTSPISVYCRFLFRLLGNIRGSSGNRGNAAR